MRKKTIYLLTLLVIALLGVIISPTYAKFTSGFITEEDVVGITLSFNLGISNIEEYEEIILEKNTYEVFNVEVTNATSDDVYYGVWYKMVNPTDITEDITIARLEGTETMTSGTITENGIQTVTLIILNQSNDTIKVNIGVGSSVTSTSDIEYLNGKYLITGTYTLPNSPNIDDGNLIPVYYDETSEVWRKADSSNLELNWYNYYDQKWANAILKDENTIVDLSNHLNNGTLRGSPTWDKMNKTLNLSDSSSWVKMGLESYDFGSDFSFVIRVKFNEITAESGGEFFGNWETGGAGFGLNSDNLLYFNVYLGESYPCVGSTDAMETDRWYTIVATYDGAQIALYIDGVQVGVDSSVSGNVGVSAAPLVMGGNPTTNDTITSGIGNHDYSEVLIFDRALTSTEVATNYASDIQLINDEELLIYYDFSDGDDIPVETILGDTSEAGTLGFYTWIPRYKYRVWNITRQAGEESTYAYSAYSNGIDILWENGTNSTGNVECSYDVTTVESETNLSDVCIYNETDTITTTSVNSSYQDAWYTHPAFTFGEEEKTGFWVGKFETTGTSTAPTVLPDTTALVSQTVSEQFTSSKVIQGYGLSSNIDAHMLTNLEWGAVAYLTYSIYGLCDGTSCRDVYINNSSSMYTGRSGGAIAGSDSLQLVNFYGSSITTSTDKYNTNGYYNYKGYKIDNSGIVTSTKDTTKVASTTGNITGVYDLSGSTNECVMGNMVDSTGAFYPSSAGTSWNGSTILVSKYYNSYSYGTISYGQYGLNRARLGDATTEVTGASDSKNNTWQPGSGITGVFSNIVNSDGSWVLRGGNSDASTAGLFSFGRYDGGSVSYRSFRTSLI